jgi:hypothetical protein
MSKFIQITKFEYSGAYSYEYVEWALTHCRDIAVVCGSEVSTAAGLPVSFYLYALGLANDEYPVIARCSGAFR